MGYEVDFLAVGDGSRSGDAIALRYGNLHGPPSEQTVITIDGGTRESGKQLAEHVRAFYQTDTVTCAVLTHPDGDHASGMREVLTELKVLQVMMHLPWDHSSGVSELITDERVTHNSLAERAKKNLLAAKEVYDLAAAQNIPVIEPFCGVGNPAVTVLGPSANYYEQCLANFKFNPGTEEAFKSGALREALQKMGAFVVGLIPESWLGERLEEPEDNAAKPENNSSVIMLLQIDGKKLLFTGDAGVPALNAAADYADRAGISLSGISVFQVPHHGSRRNLGPKVLSRLFGEARSSNATDWSACVSAGKEGAPKHPHKKVMNALTRRGAAVNVTAGKTLRYSHNAPPRPGWVAAERQPFFTQVEDDD